MTQTKTSADRGSTPLESTTFAGVTQLVEYLVANQIVVGSSPITRSFLLGGKMKYLNSKWFTFAVMTLNFYFALQSFVTGSWGMFIACSIFTIITGYSFWVQMEEQ